VQRAPAILGQTPLLQKPSAQSADVEHAPPGGDLVHLPLTQDARVKHEDELEQAILTLE